MTASSPRERTDPPRHGIAEAAHGNSGERVLSVSAHAMDARGDGEPVSAPAIRYIKWKPSAPDAAVAESEELISRTQVECERMEALIEQAVGSHARAAKASTLLQERLNLGARMLKAFQAQIEQVAGSIDAARDYQQSAQDDRREIDARLARAESELERRFRVLGGRIESLVTDVAGRLRNQIDARKAELDAAIERCAAIEEHLRGEERSRDTQRRIEVITQDLRREIADELARVAEAIRPSAVHEEAPAALDERPEDASEAVAEAAGEIPELVVLGPSMVRAAPTK